ncbi:hypothetical protein CYANOKiyG1_73530 [Okeania sp. KiyG1]|nr:hypothetical protein CYANOKiyG1_73530 [Okeania sp. KiyG1]
MATKERVGVVVSNKMDKTIVVAIENRSAHPKYGKTVVKTKNIKFTTKKINVTKAIAFGLQKLVQ